MPRLKVSRAVCVSHASRLWSLYGFTSPDDLVLEDLAMSMGVLVMDGPLDSAAAWLIRAGDRGIIRVSEAIREPSRRRFAIAHEIGHWMMHQAESSLLACTDEDMLARYVANRHELEASIFAGALLMPESLFSAKVHRRRPKKAVLNELSDYFGTGLTATALRYVEVSDDYYVLVVSENGKIKWWRASDSFEEHELWLDVRTQVPPTSLAAAFFRGESIPDKPQPMDIEDWLGELRGIHTSTVVEHAIPLPSYGQVISLLWLP